MAGSEAEEAVKIIERAMGSLLWPTSWADIVGGTPRYLEQE